MGIEIAIIIASVSALLSLIAGGVSIASIHSSNQQSSIRNQEESGAYVKMTFTEENFTPEHGGKITFHNKKDNPSLDNYDYYDATGIVNRVVQEKVVHLTDKGEQEFINSISSTRTGLPNKTSEIIGSIASSAYASLGNNEATPLRIEEIDDNNIPLLGQDVNQNNQVAEIE